MRWEHFLSGTAVAVAMTLSCAAFAGSASVPASTAPDATGGATVVAAASVDSIKLPPVASIRRESDIRPYLGPSVPSDVTTAALRRAWSTDPAIHDFVGMTEDVQ
ncbi:MAG TPA: DUF3306 domain-containing protein [Stellaceae bacterium]|nr:DUF3306 domain-containing protein [Stellaceae bacterium]